MGLLRITRAAITPGTHPQRVRRKTISMDPHPRPITDKGGNMIASTTLQKLIILVLGAARPGHATYYK